VNIVPNLRVDVPDFLAQGQEFSADLVKMHLERWIQRHYSVITEGFRVEIADQVTNPGLFTIVNGLAFDRAGQIVNNEDELNAKRSYVLTANATYFVEVEFVTDYTDTDARALWDPTYDNGTDASGDARPDGREFSQNMATRIAPDWSIVQPISTTAFARTATPNSVRIPVAVITMAAGVITGYPALTTPARTNLAEGYLLGVSAIRGLDTRHMPDAFTLRIDPGGATAELATVSANDRENGILTLAGPTTFAHTVGTRLADESVTPTAILDERTLPPLPTTGTEDARPRLFQGDEERGYALTQSPYADPGKSDLEIKTLKDMIDALAGEIRELKFGAARAADVGDIAPPSTFAAVPRWFDRAGGVAGARGNTVSVGDGVSTFGDFNTTTSGSAVAAIQAAIDSLSGNGGIIYIKEGTYNIGATPIDVDEQCCIIGDGHDSTVIQATDAGGAAAMDLNAGTDWVKLEGLSILVDTGGTGTATHALTCTSIGPRSRIQDCIIQGWDSTTTVAIFDGVFFQSPSTGTIALDGAFNQCLFRKCWFANTAYAAATRNVSMDTTISNVTFSDCEFYAVANMNAVFETDGNANLLCIKNCRVNDTGTSPPFMLTAAGDNDIRITDTHFTNDGGIGTFTGCTDVWIRGCSVSFGQDEAGATFASSCVRVRVTDTRFLQAATAGAAGTGRCLDFTSASDVKVDNCGFVDADIGIRFADLQRFAISNCHHTTPTAGRGRVGILATGSAPALFSGSITNCMFFGLDVASATDYAGILIDTGAGLANISDVRISGCDFDTIGPATGTNAYGIRVDSNGGTVSGIIVENCVFYDVDAGTLGIGISLETGVNITISGCRFSLVGNTATTTWYGVYIPSFISVVISHNTFATLGNVGATSIYNSAVYLGILTGGSQPAAAVVSNNIIRALYNNSLGYGIYFHEGAEVVTIANNTISISTSITAAIACYLATVGNHNISKINVTGNTIEGGFNGISIALAETAALVAGHIAVTNNLLRNFAATGIICHGNTVAEAFEQHSSWNISGNTLETEETTTTGISIGDITRFVISGNCIYLEAGGVATTEHGITDGGYDNWDGTVVGNMIYTESPNGDGINLAAAVNVVVVGNNVDINSDDDACIVNNDGWVAANLFRNPNVAPGNQLNITGTCLNIARRDIDSNAALDPAGADDDIDLNLRTV
jgi:hypothetical protein